jgi:hypothetical protein
MGTIRAVKLPLLIRCRYIIVSANRSRLQNYIAKTDIIYRVFAAKRLDFVVKEMSIIWSCYRNGPVLHM